MPIETTVTAIAVLTAMLAAHPLGDYVAQSDHDALGKRAPHATELADGAHPWTGWAACARHIGAYTAVQTGALLLIGVVAPIGVYGAIAALAITAATHAVIDRRWPVDILLAAKGVREGWTEGRRLIDQALHVGLLLPAAVLAAVITGPAGAVGVLLAAVGVVAAGLAVEETRARTAMTAQEGYRA